MELYLTQYFSKNKEIFLPGFGLLVFMEESARYDAEQKRLFPPNGKFVWQPGERAYGSMQGLIGYISRNTQLPEEESYEAVEAFLTEKKGLIEKMGEWDWKPFGKFVMLSEGNIGFVPATFYPTYFPEWAINTTTPEENASKDTDAVETLQPEESMVSTYPEFGEEPEGRWWLPALIFGLIMIGLMVAKITGYW